MMEKEMDCGRKKWTIDGRNGQWKEETNDVGGNR